MSRESEKPDGWNVTRYCINCGNKLEEHATVTVDGEEEGICPIEEIAVDAETSQQLLPLSEVDTDR